MSGTARFSVSLGRELMERFDRMWQTEGLPTRSEAVKAMIRRALVEQEWQHGGRVAGTIVVVYDHHARALADRLIRAQHDFEDIVICTQHAHLDHDNCLEAIIVAGASQAVGRLVKRLKAIKGLKHTALMMTTTGEKLE